MKIRSSIKKLFFYIFASPVSNPVIAFSCIAGLRRTAALHPVSFKNIPFELSLIQIDSIKRVLRELVGIRFQVPDVIQQSGEILYIAFHVKPGRPVLVLGGIRVVVDKLVRQFFI
jgi:hypothetical protein